MPSKKNKEKTFTSKWTLKSWQWRDTLDTESSRIEPLPTNVIYWHTLESCSLQIYYPHKRRKADIKAGSKNASYTYLPTPSLGQDITQGQIFKRSLTGLNSEFSVS